FHPGPRGRDRTAEDNESEENNLTGAMSRGQAGARALRSGRSGHYFASGRFQRPTRSTIAAKRGSPCSPSKAGLRAPGQGERPAHVPKASRRRPANLRKFRQREVVTARVQIYPAEESVRD